MHKTYEEVVEDLVPMARGDKKLQELYAKLYHETHAKGMTYHEPAMSKFYGTLKYIVTCHPITGVSILDLDTNEEYRCPR
jgi:hypothetical protein